MKVATIASAAATSTVRLRAMMPPDAARRIGVASAHVCVREHRLADRGAAGVRVFDYDGGRLVELEDDAGGGVEIEQG